MRIYPMSIQIRTIWKVIFMILGMAIVHGCGEPKSSSIAFVPGVEATPTPAIHLEPTAEILAANEVKEATDAEPTLVPDNIVPLAVLPAIEYITLDELQKSISLRQNKPLVVYFWASWCRPCIEEIPVIVELYKKYGNQIDFLAVSCDSFYESVDKVPDAMKTLNMAFTTRVLKADDQYKAFAVLDSSWQGAYPMTLIYNTKSEKINTFLGRQTQETFDAAMQEVLKSVEKVRIIAH